MRRRRSRPTAPVSTREAAEAELDGVEVEVEEASTNLLGDEETDAEEAEVEPDRAVINVTSAKVTTLPDPVTLGETRRRTRCSSSFSPPTLCSGSYVSIVWNPLTSSTSVPAPKMTWGVPAAPG